ncbi:hypothetical protein BC832DRAFT_529522 [Gaertneriomyces semiglobifer]|nr:hypothetical protein BC832DRAFT_529522 [Gaertneriomyces semiglobifer]
MFRPLVRAWRRYLELLEERPLVTKAVTAGVIGAAGDVLAQRITKPEHQAFVWDKQRTVRLGLYGLLVGAPLTHGWYKVLDKRLGAGMDMATSAKKVAADQIFAAAPFTCMFFACNSYMEGLSTKDVKERIERNLWPTLKANWAVWPAFLIFNFRYVPLKLRVLTVNILGLGWGTYLSLVQHREHSHTNVAPHLPDPFPQAEALPTLYPPGAVSEK